MKRGELWTMAGGPGYASKPRPSVIIQDDGFSETLSIAVCPLTSEPVEAPILRLLVEPRQFRELRLVGLDLDVHLVGPPAGPGLHAEEQGREGEQQDREVVAIAEPRGLTARGLVVEGQHDQLLAAIAHHLT